MARKEKLSVNHTIQSRTFGTKILATEIDKLLRFSCRCRVVTSRYSLVITTVQTALVTSRIREKAIS